MVPFLTRKEQCKGDTTLQSKPNIPHHRIVFFWLVGLLALGLVLLLGALSLYRDWQQEQQLQTQRRNFYQVQLKEVLETTLRAVELDTVRLATSPLLQRHLLHPSTNTLELLQEDYVSLARLRPSYDQIRLLDVNGHESVRINRSGKDVYRVSADALQNKAQRYYTAEGMKLAPGYTYLSPLDLNIEQNEIEVPFKPVLRMVHPVYRHTQLRGLVVVNYRAEELLQQLSNHLPAPLRPILLNDKGQWLHGGDQQDWQFMFEPQSGLAVEEPSLWQQMASQDFGQLTLGQDCLLYSWTAYGSQQALSPRWLIGLRESGKACNALTKQYQIHAAGLLGTTALAGFLLLFGWHRLRLKHLQLYHRLLINEQQLRLVTNEMGNGVIMIDAQGLTRWLNPEAERLLGWQEKEILGRCLHDIIHVTAEGENLDREECLTTHAIRTGQRQHRERDYLCTREGIIIPVSMTVSPLPKLESGGAVITFSDDREKVTAEKKLRQQAETDELTGYLNRRAILQQLEQVIRTDTEFGIIMFDLDRFKSVNDTYGHAAGDQVLIEYTRLARELLRPHDCVGRIGGEEFLLVIKHLHLNDLYQLAERVRESMDHHRCIITGHTLHVTASFGLAMHQRGESPGALLARTDKALYQAKNTGRNQVIADDSLKPASVDT